MYASNGCYATLLTCQCWWCMLKAYSVTKYLHEAAMVCSRSMAEKECVTHKLCRIVWRMTLPTQPAYKQQICFLFCLFTFRLCFQLVGCSFLRRVSFRFSSCIVPSTWAAALVASFALRPWQNTIIPDHLLSQPPLWHALQARLSTDYHRGLLLHQQARIATTTMTASLKETVQAILKRCMKHGSRIPTLCTYHGKSISRTWSMGCHLAKPTLHHPHWSLLAVLVCQSYQTKW